MKIQIVLQRKLKHPERRRRHHPRRQLRSPLQAHHASVQEVF